MVLVVALVTSRLSYVHSSTHLTGVGITLSCSNKTGVSPTGYVLFCADANAEFTNLTWTDWGLATAYATGTARWNDCTPNCAAGTWKSAPVTVWAWRIRDHLYTRLASSDPSLLKVMKLAPYPA